MTPTQQAGADAKTILQSLGSHGGWLFHHTDTKRSCQQQFSPPHTIPSLHYLPPALCLCLIEHALSCCQLQLFRLLKRLVDVTHCIALHHTSTPLTTVLDQQRSTLLAVCANTKANRLNMRKSVSGSPVPAVAAFSF